jgi:iron complex outermembrane receptor protein
MRILKPLGAVAAWSVVAGGFALAPLATAVAAERESSGIEEIIVTTRRTEESIQDVPVSVTAFREEDLTRIAPKNLRDLDGLMPNVFIGMNTAGPGAGAIYIRGLGYADIEKTQASAVGVIVDGLFQASSTVGQLVDTFDVEQVEVNRGPQGVLYGKNTTGGTIVVTRTRPSTEEFGFKGSVSTGSYDEQVYKARFNVPLAETLAFKIGGIQRTSDGFYENDFQGGRAGAIDYQSYTASVLWEPTDDFSAQFTYDMIEDEGDIPPQDPRFDGPDPFRNLADFDEFQYADVDSYGLQLEWNSEWGTLTSITGRVESTDNVGQDFDGAYRDVFAVIDGEIAVPSPLAQLHTLRQQKYNTSTQELRWAGDINDAWSYQVGAFWMDTHLDFQQGTNQVVQTAVPLPPGVTCAMAGLGASAAPGFCQIGPLYSVQLSEENTESLGYFGNVTWQATDQIEVSAGLRYIDDEKDFATSFWPGDAETGGALNPPTQPLGDTPNLLVPEQNDSWNDTIAKLSATWQLNDSSNVYASFSQGFRSGGFSMRGIIPEQLPYDPETVDTWEIGSKNELMDGRIRLNAAAFINTLSDAQFSSVVTDNVTPGSPGTNTLVNNAGADIEIWGLEAELTALLNDYFTFIVTGGYQDDKSDEFQISSTRVGFNANGSACNAVTNADIWPNCPTVTVGGGALARTPEWNWSTTLVYGQEFGADYLEASVSARGQDDWVISGGATSANPEYEDGYTLVDARVAYQHRVDQRDSLITVALVGKNLTDEEYREQTLPLGADGGFQGWAPPLTWAVELTWDH